MAVLVMERVATTKATTATKPQVENFTVTSVGRSLTGRDSVVWLDKKHTHWRKVTTYRQEVRIRGGGHRGAMYAYLQQLQAEGKASISMSHKSTFYRATIWLADDELPNRLIEIMKRLASGRVVSYSLNINAPKCA